MKIYQLHECVYQLHECGGSYEDYFDRIIASYVSARKAIKHKRELQKEEKIIEEKVNKCCRCPIQDMTKRKYNNKKNVLDEYCDNQNLVFEGNYIYCENTEYCDEEKIYRIEKIEVIE